MQDRYLFIELVVWRSGQVVFLPLSRPMATGSIRLKADLMP